MRNPSVCRRTGDSGIQRVSAAPARLLQAALLMLAMQGNAAWSQTCDVQPTQAAMVQANFQRVLKEGDLASAQDYAERAQRGLNQLAAQARRCGCAASQAGFEAAAGELRHLRLADSRKALREIVARSSLAFDAAMAEQRKCGG